mgnify:CR=1 FL=1
MSNYSAHTSGSSPDADAAQINNKTGGNPLTDSAHLYLSALAHDTGKLMEERRIHGNEVSSLENGLDSSLGAKCPV